METMPNPKPSLPEGWTGLHVNEAVKAATKALAESEAKLAQLQAAAAKGFSAAELFYSSAAQMLERAQNRKRYDSYILGSVNASARAYETEQSILPLEDVFIVKTICSLCGCVELEHTQQSIHTEFEPIGRKRPNPIDHEYKCVHIGR